MYNCGTLSAGLCQVHFGQLGCACRMYSKPEPIYTGFARCCTGGCAFVNQEYLAHLIAPSEPPQPVIAILLVSMVNERQVLAVRAAALYCFQCYVASTRPRHNPPSWLLCYQNQLMSTPNKKTGFGHEDLLRIVSALIPGESLFYRLLSVQSRNKSQPISVGQLLCGGLFSNDVLSTWFSSIALSHCITENISLQEELLRVHLASGPDGTSVSLLQQCFIWFQKVRIHSVPFIRNAHAPVK
ncbi:hypothetical protein AHF37_12257 [Paragonimus kellicotti]|nr:hypothetical protein AHF37_12257 [Paragonimus kellicotti]